MYVGYDLHVYLFHESYIKIEPFITKKNSAGMWQKWALLIFIYICLYVLLLMVLAVFHNEYILNVYLIVLNTRNGVRLSIFTWLMHDVLMRKIELLNPCNAYIFFII